MDNKAYITDYGQKLLNDAYREYVEGLKQKVAELEAENKLVKADFDRMQRQCKHEKMRAEQAEAKTAALTANRDELVHMVGLLKAELAALKARCCDNCAWTTCWIWAVTDLSPSWHGAEEGIMCRLWAERGGG